MRVEFEWRIVPVDNVVGRRPVVVVIERLIGYDKHNEFGPMPAEIAPAFVSARRKFVERQARTRHNAIKLFTPAQGPTTNA